MTGEGYQQAPAVGGSVPDGVVRPSTRPCVHRQCVCEGSGLLTRGGGGEHAHLIRQSFVVRTASSTELASALLELEYALTGAWGDCLNLETPRNWRRMVKVLGGAVRTCRG